MTASKLSGDLAQAFAGDPTLPGHPDPYPLFRRLREQDAVHFSAHMNGWVLTRYADGIAYLRDHRFSRGAYLDSMQRQYGDSSILSGQRRELAFMDASAHAQARSLIGKPFTPHQIDALRAQIQRIVDAQLDQVSGVGEMDIIADLAYPLPAMVIIDMLGVPRGDAPALREWVEGFVMARGVVRTPEMLEAGDRSTRAFHDYLGGLHDQRAKDLGLDLMSVLIEAEESGARLSREDILAQMTSIFAAGHATTRSLIANGMLALLRNPSEMDKLREHPALIVGAVEEMLRYDPPTQAPSPQVALEDVEIGGQSVKEGQTVSVLIGACNRDPDRFADPERFDIERRDNEHLSFSFGAHYCLGAALARAEAQIAIATMVHRMPEIRLAVAQPEYEKMGRFRVIKALPVKF
ncbi:MAG TPA: cytochrome P450 [Candidatus Binataceae bacterium]|nr:cytochrome P450 [Candidatus Binataceae bacterium]